METFLHKCKRTRIHAHTNRRHEAPGCVTWKPQETWQEYPHVHAGNQLPWQLRPRECFILWGSWEILKALGCLWFDPAWFMTAKNINKWGCNVTALSSVPLKTACSLSLSLFCFRKCYSQAFKMMSENGAACTWRRTLIHWSCNVSDTHCDRTTPQHVRVRTSALFSAWLSNLQFKRLPMRSADFNPVQNHNACSIYKSEK